MKAPARTPRKRQTRRPKNVDAALIERIATHYLNRFDATRERLKTVLVRRCAKLTRELEPEARPDEADVLRWIEELLDRSERSSMICDTRFAGNLARSLRERGMGRRAIEQKLRLKGVPKALIPGALEQVDGESEDPELEAARRWVRRRRLGLFRPAEQRQERRQRDFAALARAGFSYGVAAQALTTPEEDFQEEVGNYEIL